MIKLIEPEFDITKYRPRDAVREVLDFINSDICTQGKICTLYGLRRTGKTTIMWQSLYACEDKYKCAFYEAHEDDDIHVIEQMLSDEHKQGTKVVFIDEITRIVDFVYNSSTLADVFAFCGMRIIVTGTDSLGLLYAENDTLFDRTVDISTTHISYAEHSRVLGTYDIDEYVRYGGLMYKGLGKAYAVHHNIIAKRYLDSAVSANITNSLKRSRKNESIDVFTDVELRSVIEKLMEVYSGKFKITEMQSQLKTANVTLPLKFMQKDIDSDTLIKLTTNRADVIEEFLHRINADATITTEVTERLVETLYTTLSWMNVVSVTKEIPLAFDESGWHRLQTIYQYYIVQPAIKYNHLKEGKEIIEKSAYYEALDAGMRRAMSQKLEQIILVHIIEQIVLFDTQCALSNEHYDVFKPTFTVKGKSAGEYDMLIFDKENLCHWAFEIKHTTEPSVEQLKNLLNTKFDSYTEYQFGKSIGKFLLYRGESFKTPEGITYLNISDFLITVDEYKDMYKVIEHLTDGLSTLYLS